MSNPISSPLEFKNFKKFHYTLAGRPLVIETGTERSKIRILRKAVESCLTVHED